jgi:hypothetical protein
MSRPTPEQIRAAGEKAMKDMRATFGPSVNADVIDLAERNRRNALFVLDVLVRAYVPKNTNDWREGLAALQLLQVPHKSAGGAGAATDPLDRCKQIRERVAELEAEVQRLVKEHETLTGGPWQKPDADDMAWATGKARVGEVGRGE